VSGVLIPYSPVIGKFVGSAVGAGLFSSVINTAFELRMQKFREQKKSGRDIARTVFKTAMTDAMLAPVTLGLGGGGAAAAGKGLGEMAKEVFKTASVQFLGNAIMTVAGKAMGQQYTAGADALAADAAEATTADGVPPEAFGGQFTGGTIPIMSGPGLTDGENTVESGTEDPEGSGASSVSIANASRNRDGARGASASEDVQAGTSDDQMRSGSGAEGNGGQDETDPSAGFSREVEHAAWQTLLASRVGVMAALVPRSIPGGVAMHWFVAYAFTGTNR
ncbi:MAG TPA: hypothetical protein PKO06_21265, partial [Candidatus Ozemobacteraceae bacterium]|nr:hypothetical protein [Candidatus Ozemobacteraceae bacterium]